MVDITLNLSHLPTVPEKKTWDSMTESIDSYCSHLGNTLRNDWREYRRLFIGLLFLIVVITIILLIVLLKSPTPSYPCIAYQSNTLASDVSVACLQYVWNQNCGTGYTFPSNYNGWWRSSTKGGTMVSCHQSSSCGVGSYSNILIYMHQCNINYNQ